MLYFLLVDRFSDNNENGYKDIAGNAVTTGSTRIFAPADNQNAIQNADDARNWRNAGTKFVGGNLAGLKSKIGYLKRMGVTAIWVSPIFKQVSFTETYHGYGIQDYLQVEPKFGSNEDLKDLVSVAHDNGIYVILDIILNHTGNIFSYDPNRQPNYKDKNGSFDPRWDGNPYPVLGFNDKRGNPSIPFRKTNPSVTNDLSRSQWSNLAGRVPGPEFLYQKRTHF